MFSFSGCQGPAGKNTDKELLVITFEPQKTLKYKMVSQRTVGIELVTPSKPDMKNNAHKMTEMLELVMLYTPIEVDPFGLTTIQAKCESAKVTRTSFSSKKPEADAIEQLAGKTFTFQLSPVGKIADFTEMTTLVKQLGQKAFVANSGQNRRIKNPDMIMDFVALQWYLWDSVSTIKKPLDGVGPGTTWQTEQLVPMPMAKLVVRDTTYTFQKAADTETGRKATITSNFALSKKELENWPMPYEGGFSVKGSLFSVLTNFKTQSLEGKGTQLFDIDRGIVENDLQEYKVKSVASFILPLGDSTPYINVDQKMSVQLIED